MRHRTLGVVAALGPVLQAACTDAASEPPASFPFAPDAGPVVAFLDAFDVVDSLAIEENDSVVVALPIVDFDGERFLMADMYSFQVREYATAGTLLFAAGRQGDGPGEYRGPVAASRTLDGGILVTDAAAMRSTYYSPDAPHDPTVEELPFLAFQQVDLGMGRRLVAGSELSHLPGQPKHALHIWHAGTGETERSFLTDPFPKHLEPMSYTYASTYVRVREDTIWAVYALSDSVHAFTLDGDRIGTIPLPLYEPPDPDGPLWDITNLHFLGEEEIVVEVGYRDRETMEKTFHLAIVDRQGNPRALLHDTPLLMVVAGEVLYFQNPGHLESSQWIAARRKGQL